MKRILAPASRWVVKFNERQRKQSVPSAGVCLVLQPFTSSYVECWEKVALSSPSRRQQGDKGREQVSMSRELLWKADIVGALTPKGLARIVAWYF